MRRHWRKSSTSAHLIAQLEVKELDAGTRTFRGALSTSHLDLGNGWMKDIVHPGAFKRWAKTVGGKGGSYTPLLDSHNRWSVLSVFGHLLEAQEQETGKSLSYELEGGKTLTVPEMKLDTAWQIIDGEDGDKILDRLRPGSVRKMSMGYEAIRWDIGKLADGSQLRNLREVKVEEGSLVVFPMNPNAEVDLSTVKGLLAWADGTPLTLEQRTALAAIHPDLKAALEASPEPAEQDPPAPVPAVKVVPAEDPKRLEQASLLRQLKLRSLAIG